MRPLKEAQRIDEHETSRQKGRIAQIGPFEHHESRAEIEATADTVGP
jgi:hypothetical protein